MAEKLDWVRLTNKTVGILMLLFGFVFFGQAWLSGHITRMAIPFILIIIGIWLLWPKSE